MTQLFPLDRTWKFRRLATEGTAATAWVEVDLPHSPFVGDLDGRTHWFGECEYQRTIARPPDAPAGRCTLYVGAAMHSAVVLVDGTERGRHTGGFLPFEIDLTAALRDNQPHALTLRLDNRDNPAVPPGKPYADLDFCWYGGLYRGAELRCYPALHITDEVGAGVVAGGGMFVRTLAASETAATVSIKTHVRNTGAAEAAFLCEIELRHGGVVVAQGASARLQLAAGAATSVELELQVKHPVLWQIDTPALHQAQATLRPTAGAAGARRTVRFGIRWITFSRSGGFTLNGRRLRLRGTNRHQEYPRVGYAVPAAAQRRDARRIKEAGFDYVRLSHYPQSPDFLDACDELGIVVMNCIPGWQFIGDEAFRAACVQNSRELIRRDRNHPCVVLWELSLNETDMSEGFMAQLHAAGHEEHPGDQMFTCGWKDRFDVYIHSRQHGEIHRWQNGDKALVIAEYGDWEFYASNHGFDQKTGAGIYAGWSHGRQLRAAGERGLRQQLENHIVALNDTLSSPAVFDGQWSVFDYARGYDPNRAACGIMDIFRLSKFSYYFYRSQRDATARGAGWAGGPLVHIASHWTPASDLRVVILSNCEEVELRLNGRRRRFRGTNRHQDYPSVGYAVPRAAQYRDARRIKEAGFDYVRLSHYPQSPDFLDACDELGLLVMNCLPGWQFIGGEEFREACYRNARELVRRDRNHPCVVLWELSLNETDMDEAFMARLHGIGHDEFPGDQMFTCGWIDRYDVFTHSRQHGQIHRWRNGDKALVIAECADWEFFAATHGFDQKSGAGVFDRWSTARQFRGDGERGLRQQVSHHLTTLNDTLSSPAVLEGQWAMFDYPRGYDPVRAAVGVMDFYRLPKFSYHFYRSQRDPSEAGAGWATGPVVFIASHWLPSSDLRVLVFSNCEEVELRLGGVLVGRQHPARTALTQHLPHPPFVFDLPRFAPGTLEAAAFIGGRRQASHSVATPGPAAGLALAVDDLAVVAATGEPDLLCVHARVVDAPGTLCCEATAPVSFVLEGRADLLGGPTVDAEAGIASLVVRVPAGSSGFLLGARTQVAGRGFAATLEWRRPVSVPATAPTRGEFAPAD